MIWCVCYSLLQPKSGFADVHRWGFIIDDMGMGVDGMRIDTNGVGMGPWMQAWALTKYCTLMTTSSVTCHKLLRREEIFTVTLQFEKVFTTKNFRLPKWPVVHLRQKNIVQWKNCCSMAF